MYPPGQFSAWNRASIRAAWLGDSGPGGSGEPDGEPGYSALAVSDPSADATVTQTWAAIEEDQPSDGWAPRSDRDWGSHTGETGPVPRHTPDGRPAAPGRTAPRGRTVLPGRRPGGDIRRGARAAQPGRPGSSAPRPAHSPKTTAPGITATGITAAGITAAGITAPGPAQPPRTTPPETVAPEPVIPRADDRAPVTRQVPSTADEAEGGQRSGPASTGQAAPAARRTGKKRRRHGLMLATLLLAPVLIVMMVAAGYVYFSHKHAAAAADPAPAPRHTPTVQASPTPTLGPWKHIASRNQDPAPLTVTQLFPQQFSANNATGTRTVDKASSNCSHEVFGSALAKAVRKADCTQVMRASYLSTDHKLMATVGVLNLSDVAAAEQVGKVSGSAEFIKQLPAAHGPTRNLSKGTGIEEAEIKGHYLILIWTEFTDLKAPKGKSQRKKLEAFSAGLIAGTANVSLTKRMVTGQP